MEYESRGIGSGNVIITLTPSDGGAEETLILRPTIHAMRTLSRKYGGLNPLVDRIGKLEFDVIVDVIEAGMGNTGSPKERERLAEKIYQSGLSDDTGSLPLLCIDYCTNLMRGGRPKPQFQAGVVEDLTPGNPPIKG